MARLRDRGSSSLRLNARRRGLTILGASSLRLDAPSALTLVGNGALLIDVRRLDDPSGALEGALRIPPDEIPARLAELPRDTPIVLACT